MQDRWDKFLFEEALGWFTKFQGKTIVEIGAIRDAKSVAEHSDGWSTKHWAATDADVYCVDVDQRAIDTTKLLVTAVFSNVFYHCQDGVEFLKGFKQYADLLYLDGPDADKGGQEVHLQMFMWAPLPEQSIILIDDCDSMPQRWRGRGKGELVIPVALRRSFKVVADNGRQVLLVREKY